MKTDKNAKTYSRPSDEEIKRMLTPLQYKVTQKEGTEPAFTMSIGITSMKAFMWTLFLASRCSVRLDKYDSGTGWPSFTKPLEPENIEEKPDNTLLSRRTEVRSRIADAHLGHVFNDGPKATGLRYCMNSAALRFIPKEALEKESYGQYARLFGK